MSSTRRTEMPARYISISASSTELSRRRYRSMIAVSKVWRRSWNLAIPFARAGLQCPLIAARPGVLTTLAALVTASTAELVCLSIQHGIQRLFHRATNQLAKMVPDTGFIDLDHLTHRLLVPHRLLLHCMKKPSILKVQKILYVIRPTYARAHIEPVL